MLSKIEKLKIELNELEIEFNQAMTLVEDPTDFNIKDDPAFSIAKAAYLKWLQAGIELDAYELKKEVNKTK